MNEESKKKAWLGLTESIAANQRAIKTQVASEYSFNELMKELKSCQ